MKNTAKNIRSVVCALIAAVLVLTLTTVALADYPKAESYVADSASVLSENTVRSLRKSNENLKKDYGAVVAVCTVTSTGDETTKDYAHAIFSEWKMSEGILLLIVSDTQDYYIVPSTGLDEIISNDQLLTVRNDYLEPDFATGNIDRAVQKSTTKLTSLIERGFQSKAQNDKNSESDSEGGTTAGDVIVTILKVILYVVLIAIGIFAVLFVVALFNDDVALLLNKYVFNRKKNQRSGIPAEYYDERLYGRGQPERARREAPARESAMRERPRDAYPAEYRERPRQNPSPRPRQNPQNRMYDEYRNQRQNHADVFYNSDGTVRRPRASSDDDATQMFNIPSQGRRR
ncbi:MAG: TPM domain-containing protein [Clostridia bacterium]|nr:TPM domain-containing protein [Clostridia bacterium]